MTGVSLPKRIRLFLAVNAPWRRALQRRPVFREVQGVALWMPWSHRLPDYARAAPDYGQNLVQLAGFLGDRETGVQMIDLGANIGDSTVQVLSRVSGSVLAIEGDPEYLTYLLRNVQTRPAVTVAPYLLTTEADRDRSWTASRSGGTAHFREDADGTAPDGIGTQPSLALSELISRYPEFDRVRLIKSDTDGYDTTLVPGLAALYAASRPVLFFEYDPQLTATVADAVAEDVWPILAASGYDTVAFWSNVGAPLTVVSIQEAAAEAAELLTRSGVRYLDAAVTHREDAAGRDALERMFVTSPES